MKGQEERQIEGKEEWNEGRDRHDEKEQGMELLIPSHKNDGANVMDLLLMITIRYQMKVTHRTVLEKSIPKVWEWNKFGERGRTAFHIKELDYFERVIRQSKEKDALR